MHKHKPAIKPKNRSFCLLQRIREAFSDDTTNLNGIDSAWMGYVFKRGYAGTFHNFSVKYMTLYANEFTFRLNLGQC